MKKCLLCERERCEKYLDFGMQPISHRYHTAGEKAVQVPIALGQCGHCGLVQLMEPVAAHILKPKYDWIRYRDPEGHLDELVDAIRKLPTLSETSTIVGVSYKDETTLERFRRLGYQNVWCIDQVRDLDISDPTAGVETILTQLTPKNLKSLWSKRELADVVIARHIIEHSGNMKALIEALKTIVKPSGYIIFEIPDCEHAFERLNYTAVWEDHSLYFTEQTFRYLFEFGGLFLIGVERYPYPYEDCLVGISKVAPPGIISIQSSPSSLRPAEIQKEIKQFGGYATHYPSQKTKIQDRLRFLKKKYPRIAMFGAGHWASAFINLMDIQAFIDVVIDDDLHKIGYRMPGTEVIISGSEVLVDRGVTDLEVDLCLMSLSVESERQVARKHTSFIEKGGKFLSIFQLGSLTLMSGDFSC